MYYPSGDDMRIGPNYQRGELPFYLRCADAAGVASPLFLKIMNLREDCFSDEDKDHYLDFYASVYPDFFRQVKGARPHVKPDPKVSPGYAQISAPYKGPSANDERDPDTRQDRLVEIERLTAEADLLGFILVKKGTPGCAVSGGRKSRRRSNRKNRSRR